MAKERKILLAAYSLEVGGIEKALITLANKLNDDGYQVTITLEKMQGIFLEKINKNIKIIEYRPNENKNIILRKFINMMKRVSFIIKYKNKFDFSACFATYSKSASFISRITSKNNALWVHTDYLTLYQNDINKVKDFFNSINYDKFKRIVFVSKVAKENFVNLFPNLNSKVIVCNNLVDYKQIKNLSMEKIELNVDKNLPIFLNVGRHDEESKRLTRIIEAAGMLVKDGLDFRILFVGDGIDTGKYKNMVKSNNLENYIIFLGKKENPYPYFKISDCVLLTSEYEGYPVVFLESFILNKPLITTKVSDYMDVENRFGYVVEKNSVDIYEKMKEFIKKGYKIEDKFNVEEYNGEIMKKIEDIIE